MHENYSWLQNPAKCISKWSKALTLGLGKSVGLVSQHTAHTDAEENENLLQVLFTHSQEVKMDKRYNGEVPLCVSVWRAHHHCSQVSIEAGADVNALTTYAKSTLLGATTHGDYKQVKLLLNHGVYINLVNARGRMLVLTTWPKIHQFTWKLNIC